MKLPDHETHRCIASRTVPIFRSIQRMYVDISKLFGTSRKVSKTSARLVHTAQVLQSQLDAEYHAVTSQAEFEAHRHVYYPGERLADHEDADVAVLGLQDLQGALAVLFSFADAASAEDKAAFLEKHDERVGALLLLGPVAEGILTRLGYAQHSNRKIDALIEKYTEELSNAQQS